MYGVAFFTFRRVWYCFKSMPLLVLKKWFSILLLQYTVRQGGCPVDSKQNSVFTPLLYLPITLSVFYLYRMCNSPVCNCRMTKTTPLWTICNSHTVIWICSSSRFDSSSQLTVSPRLIFTKGKNWVIPVALIMSPVLLTYGLWLSQCLMVEFEFNLIMKQDEYCLYVLRTRKAIAKATPID